MPRPPRAAIMGAAALALIAGGTVHLASSGGALSPEPSSAVSSAHTSQAARPRSATASSDGEGRSGAAVSTSPSTSSGGSSAKLVVHVSGAVATPGVIELPAGSRVDDAITAAGGARSDADLDALNLARPATDGERIHVPVPGEPPPAAAGQAASSAPASGGSTSGAAAGGTSSGGGAININTADATQLDELPGVGPAIAQRIVEHRQTAGPFRSVDDLQDVPGIGPSTLDKIRAHATV